MKNYIVLLLAFITLTSCKEKRENMSKEDIIKENILNNENIINYESFDLTSLYEIIKLGEPREETVAERRYKDPKGWIEKLKKPRKYGQKKELSSEAKRFIKEKETEDEFLKKQTDDNKTAVYLYTFLAKKSKNDRTQRFHATILNDENYSVLFIRKD